MVDTCRLTSGADPRLGMEKEMIQIDYLLLVYTETGRSGFSWRTWANQQVLDRLPFRESTYVLEDAQVDFMNIVVGPQTPVNPRSHAELILSRAAQ